MKTFALVILAAGIAGCGTDTHSLVKDTPGGAEVTIVGDKATAIANSFKDAGVEGERKPHSFHRNWDLIAKCDIDLGTNDACTLTRPNGTVVSVTGGKATTIANSFKAAGVAGERRPQSFHRYWNVVSKCNIDVGRNDICTLATFSADSGASDKLVTLKP
ncbi:MAG: hypothetical protein NTV34_17400 [Proteobacteria bacterium]|nr:hypothetical protein [Pseudomonadota bacterium]